MEVVKIVASGAPQVYHVPTALCLIRFGTRGRHSGCRVYEESKHLSAVVRRGGRTREGHLMRVKACVAAGIMGLALLASSVLPAAGEDSSKGITLRYPVKFVCGDPGGGPQPVPDVQLPLTRGRYHTAINVHNPSVDRAVVFVKKVAVASASPYEGAQRPGKITPFVQAELHANEAFEIDCPEIAGVTGLPIGMGNYIKGFVVIMSPSELDVVAVYTARPQGDNDISTLQVLPVPGHQQHEDFSDPR